MRWWNRPFPGGVHPPDHKVESTGHPLNRAELPSRLFVPLQQHIGAPARPDVAVGDSVLRGQRLASAEGQVSAPVHAPTSGRVVAIEPHPLPHPLAISAPCVVLEPDGNDQRAEPLGPPLSAFRELPRATLLERIGNAGIVGLGGAGFPAFIKLQAGAAGIETLIINGAECEPYITCDDLLMREYADEVVAGAEILAHLLDAHHTVIAIEDNKPEAAAAMRHAVATADNGLTVALLPTLYPAGGEKQLIQAVTGREVPSGGLPAAIGTACHNVATARAVARAVLYGEPLTERIVTVTGAAVDQPRNLIVPIGLPVAELLDQCGRTAGGYRKLLVGGPMMGFALFTEQVPVTKTTNCLLAAGEADLPPQAPVRPCIRCGQCADVCPAGLLPQELYWHARSRNLERAEAFGLFDCIECGCCAWVCPSRLPLVHYYRSTKEAVREQRAEREQAERARQRFEARQARLERDKQEKAARHKQAAAATRSGDEAKQRAIAEALERTRAKKAAQQAETTTREPEA